MHRRNSGYAEVGLALGQNGQERLYSSFLTKILLRNSLHLSFLLSLFSVFESETGRQGRDLSRVWLERPRNAGLLEPGDSAWLLSSALHPPTTQVVRVILTMMGQQAL